MSLDSKTRKRLKQIAHHLNVVVTVGEKLSDGLLAETERALDDHELIKVRVHCPDRVARSALGDELAERCDAQVVQRIGKILVLYRENPQPNAALSNLHRFG